MAALSNMWTYYQVLAWVRWRKPTVVAEFAKGEAAGWWRGAMLYPNMSIFPGALPSKFPEVCSNAETQLNKQIQRGVISAWMLRGPALEQIQPAAWAAVRIRVDLNQLRFKSTEVQRCFGDVSAPAQVRLKTEPETLQALRDRMAKAPRTRGESRESIFHELNPSVTPMRWNELWKQVAAEAPSDPSWGKPGPGRRVK